MHDHQRACETKIRAAIITGTIDACHERCPKRKKQPTEETLSVLGQVSSQLIRIGRHGQRR
jgi:hypothetical protein